MDVEVVDGEGEIRAFGHLCAVSVLCSRQYVPLQEGQRNGRKSSWLQVGREQWEPMASRSASAAVAVDDDGVGIGDIFGGFSEYELVKSGRDGEKR